MANHLLNEPTPTLGWSGFAAVYGMLSFLELVPCEVVYKLVVSQAISLNFTTTTQNVKFIMTCQGAGVA